MFSRFSSQYFPVDFHVDPDTKQLVNTALKVQSTEDRAPEFITKPKRQFVNEGESAKFKASFEAWLGAEISWSLDGKTISNGGRYKVELSFS